MNMSTLALFSMPSGGEWLIVGVIALLLFGRRLPEIAQSLGQSIVAFKRGIRDVTQDIDKEARLPGPPNQSVDQRERTE
jgi:sec-independent protein translocase protein TatA